MINTYISQYLDTLLSDFSQNAQNNASGLISAILVYIPIHFLLKWLLGEKNSRYAFVAYLVTLAVSLTGVFMGA